jgi:hypothetical protein
MNHTQGTFEIVYCKLSDGSPCANWAWRGKTPQAVAVLDRRGARSNRIQTARHSLRFELWGYQHVNPRYEYREWSAMLRQMQAEIAALLKEVQ